MYPELYSDRIVRYKEKCRDIKNKKKQGIKNPYDHFINNIPSEIKGLANKKEE